MCVVYEGGGGGRKRGKENKNSELERYFLFYYNSPLLVFNSVSYCNGAIGTALISYLFIIIVIFLYLNGYEEEEDLLQLIHTPMCVHEHS